VPVADGAPRNDETKPLREESAPEIDETKPLRAEISPGNVETKPFELVQPTAGVAPGATRSAIKPPVLVHDDSNEKGRHHSQALGAGEPSREFACRQKAARGRTDLALAEMT